MQKLFSIKSDLAPLLKLVVPLALMAVIQSSIWFFQTVFLARLGVQTLAASSLVTWFFGTIAVVLFGTLSSINILVAYKHGAKDDAGISRVARDGIILAILLVIPAIFLLWNMADVFAWLGQPQSVVILARAYLHALSWGLLADFVTMAFFEVMIGLGYTRIILVFSTLFVILNIFLSYALILGKFGFAKLGMAGAGWAMTISYWIIFFIFLVYIFSRKTYRYYFRDVFKLIKTQYVSELFKLGIPMGGMYFVEVGFFFILALMMGLLGSQYQAANQVALQYLNLTINIVFAVAQAITVRMGYFLGAEQAPVAQRAAYAGISLSAFVTLIAAVIYLVLPEVLISVDIDIHDPKNLELIKLSRDFLIICTLYQFVEALRIAFFGALRGLKDTHFSLITSIIGFWAISIPLGYWLAVYYKLGGLGFWWAMILGSSISALLLWWRFRSKISEAVAIK